MRTKHYGKPPSVEETFDVDLELVLLTARWIILALIATGLAMYPRGAAHRLWSLVAVAVAYNVLALMSVTRARWRKALRVAEPIVYGTLSLLGLLGTGGLGSIFLPLLPTQLVAVCMLTPYRRALPVSIALVLGFTAGCLVWYPKTDPA